MKRISSWVGWAVVKWIFPGMFLAWAAGVVVLFATSDDAPPVALWAMLPCLLAIGAVAYVRRVWPLARTVEDAGDHLVVRRGGNVLSLRLADVINVNQSGTWSTIRLRLRDAGPLGDEVAFIPIVIHAAPFARHPVAEDLLRRAGQARRGLPDSRSTA